MQNAHQSQKLFFDICKICKQFQGIMTHRICAPVLLNLLNLLGKTDEMFDKARHPIFF